MKTMAVTLVLCLACGIIQAQDDTFAAAQPSPEHEVLNHEVGTWDAEVTMHLPGQDQPIESQGTETNKMVGKFWVVSDFKYEFMGQPMGGHGTFGFDPSSGKYVGSWMGSDNPYVIHMVGEYDEKTRKMTYQMEGKDQTGGPMKGKIVNTYVDDDHKTFEMFFDIGGEMTKLMEVKYTKK